MKNIKAEIEKIEFAMLYTSHGIEMEKLEKKKELLQKELLEILVKVREESCT
jgi:hypothetical protein